MNPDTVLQVTQHDVALVRRTLRHLTAMQKLTCIAAVVVTGLIWWVLLQRLLAFGRNIDYTDSPLLGTQTVTLLQQYNPFFWWGVVILITLLIVYFLYGFITSTQRRVRRKLLTRASVEKLATQLSESGREVLNWSWQDRRDPINVGVLQQALAEMRGNRAGKITLARQHLALLSPSPAQESATKPVAMRSEL